MSALQQRAKQLFSTESEWPHRPCRQQIPLRTDLELLAEAKVTNTITQTLAVMEFVEIPNLEYYI